MVERTHIGIFGARNVGKSSLINLITGQDVSIVSPEAGTTTDPVTKPIEINGLGATVLIDTAGYDDEGKLGAMRVSRTKDVVKRCDIALFVISSRMIDDAKQINDAKQWYSLINQFCQKTLIILNIFDDSISLSDSQLKKIDFNSNSTPILVNCLKGEGRNRLFAALGHIKERDLKSKSIVTHLINKGDSVMLVMPQDIQAPAGRLILPQVQTIRELLDFGCTVLCTTNDNFTESINKLEQPPNLIVVDSQVFSEIYNLKPDNSRLTSFSVLFAQWKGDIDTYIKGVQTLSKLNSKSRILIAEACTHAPLAEDIGREKIPNLIHSRISDKIVIDIVSGNDIPKDLSRYDLIIQCGACMFSRANVINRIEEANAAGVAITNYGIVMAYFSNILDKIVW